MDRLADVVSRGAKENRVAIEADLRALVGQPVSELARDIANGPQMGGESWRRV